MYTGYGIIKGVKSIDGETAEFIIDPPWGKMNEEFDVKMSLWIYIENNLGVGGPVIFDYQL